MVNSVLHVICGNCGNGSPESKSVQTFFDYDAGRPCAAITCKICSTMHYLTAATDSSTEPLRARVAELEKDRERLDWLCLNLGAVEIDIIDCDASGITEVRIITPKQWFIGDDLRQAIDDARKEVQG